ncbi:MAG: hypothetical protein KGH61_03290 [Candidatus Micrarchaeota archaeon]|nr:hypothetical protein [Candidatus Micrarchaeota archaeon]MDE1847948.1 hypothetical protein [Candidatus Micrarchaeota archaeon]MDE1864335.1 hypothetical protein [Candidatus Micrarchaeota archaeon]
MSAYGMFLLITAVSCVILVSEVYGSLQSLSSIQIDYSSLASIVRLGYLHSTSLSSNNSTYSEYLLEMDSQGISYTQNHAYAGGYGNAKNTT